MPMFDIKQLIAKKYIVPDPKTRLYKVASRYMVAWLKERPLTEYFNYDASSDKWIVYDADMDPCGPPVAETRAIFMVSRAI